MYLTTGNPRDEYYSLTRIKTLTIFILIARNLELYYAITASSWR